LIPLKLTHYLDTF